MKTKRLLWIGAGILLLGFVCIILGGIWLANNSQVVIVGQWSCPVTNSTMSVYKFAVSDGDITNTTCNTQDLQQASVTLTNGDTYPFYIEYDGHYASWDIPQGFTCTASWADGEFTSAGNQAVQEKSSVSLNCTDHNGHALYMESKLIFTSQQG